MFLVGHELDNLPQPNRLFLGGRKKKTPKRRTKTNRPPRPLRPRTPWLPGTVPTCRPAHPWRPRSWRLMAACFWYMLVGRWLNWPFFLRGLCFFWRSQNLSEILLMEETWDVESLVNNGINYQPQLVSWISEPSTVPSISQFLVRSLGMKFKKPLWRVWKVFENCDGNLSPFGQGNFPTTHILISYLSRISTRWLASCSVSRY